MGLFERDNGEVVASFEPEYADVLRDLIGQTSDLLGRPIDRHDPGVARLFPDGYAGADEAAEFRRLTESELRSEKAAAAELLLSTVPEGGGEVRLDEQDADAWLRALNDVRLLLGTRLDLTDDSDIASELSAEVARDPASPRVGQLAVYGLLSEIQESLLTALAGW